MGPLPSIWYARETSPRQAYSIGGISISDDSHTCCLCQVLPGREPGGVVAGWGPWAAQRACSLCQTARWAIGKGEGCRCWGSWELPNPKPSPPPHAILRNVTSVGSLGYNSKHIQVGYRWAGATLRVIHVGEIVHIHLNSNASIDVWSDGGCECASPTLPNRPNRGCYLRPFLVEPHPPIGPTIRSIR